MIEEEDSRWMQVALREAEKAYEAGEVPIGAVIVKDGRCLAKAYNQVETLKDATAHAEIIAIGAASSQVGNWRLSGATLYVTLEPCPMCAGAILNSRISRIVFGSPDSRFGGCGSTIDVITDNALGVNVQVTGGVSAEECLGLIRAFFMEMRQKKGDSGAKPSSLLPA